MMPHNFIPTSTIDFSTHRILYECRRCGMGRMLSTDGEKSRGAGKYVYSIDVPNRKRLFVRSVPEHLSCNVFGDQNLMIHYDDPDDGDEYDGDDEDYDEDD